MTGSEEDETSVRSEENAGISLESIPLHSTNLLTLLDSDGYVRYESPSIERIYGFDQEELVGEAVAKYFHPADRERVMQAFQRVLESEEQIVEAVEYRHETADGSYLWVESVASSDPTPDGHYVVNSRDVSASREREEELKRKNERLDSFASVIAHDLRNPLNVAGLRLELARDECDTEQLAHIEQAHDRMETLIEDVLTLARSGSETENTVWIDLGRTVDRCWQNVPTGSAQLVVDTAVEIHADRSRLEQLLENLFRNSVEHGSTYSDDAVEHAATEHVTVTVGDLDDGFYIADDGAGIAADRREQVFESGFSTSEGGTGFGLSIVREIAAAHGWQTEITESDAGGAQIEITGVKRRE